MNLLDLQKISTRERLTNVISKDVFLMFFRVQANSYMNTIPNTNPYKTLILTFIKLLY